MDRPQSREEVPAKRQKVESQVQDGFTSDANECVFFRLVRFQQDVNESTPSFHPDFSHQVFEDEQIWGYKGLQVNIYLHAVTFHAYVEVKYTQKVSGRTILGSLFGGDNKPADDIEALLKEHAFPEGFTTCKEEFIKNLSTYNTTALPSNAQMKSQGQVDASGSSWRILKFPVGEPTPVGKLVREWHARMEPMAIFYIDGASAIDSEDSRWEMLALMEVDGKGIPSVAGYLTVYRFYGWPDKSRLRISQVMVLPPFQQRGHGTRMIQAVYDMARDGEYLDVTTEDPTDVLRRVRDRVELRAALATSALANAALAAVHAAASPSSKAGDVRSITKQLVIPSALVATGREQCKMTKAQVAKCWEGLVYLAGKKYEYDQSPPLAGAFKGLVLRRLKAAQRSLQTSAQGKSVLDTPDGFVMFKGSSKGEGENAGKQNVMAQSQEVRKQTEQAMAALEQAGIRIPGLTGGSLAAAAAGGDPADDEAEAPPPSLDDQYLQILRDLEAMTASLDIKQIEV